MEFREKYKEIFQNLLDEYKTKLRKLESEPKSKDFSESTQRAYDAFELEGEIGIVEEYLEKYEELGSPESVCSKLKIKALDFHSKASYEGEYPTFDWNSDHYWYFVYMGEYCACERLSEEIGKLVENN